MGIGDKIIDVAKEKALEVGTGAIDTVKDTAISNVKSIVAEAGLTGLKDSLKDQLNIDGAINELKKNIDVGSIIGLNGLPNDVKSEFDVSGMTSDIDVNNIFGDIDFSELEAQGVDTTEIKKMMSDAQSEINKMSVDVPDFSLDAKSMGLDIDVKSIFTGSTSDIKNNIQKVISQIKNPQDIDAVKTIKDVASSMKTQVPDSIKAQTSEVKSQVSSMTSQIQSTMRSMGSSFGGFRR